MLAEWAAIAIDHARLCRRCGERSDELERAIEGLEATTAISRAVGLGDGPRARARAGGQARARARARAGIVVLLLEEGGRLVVADGAGQVAEGARRRVGCRSPGRWRARCSRAAGPSGSATSAARFGIADEALGVPGAETALLVPLRLRGRSLGVLVRVRPAGRGRRGSATARRSSCCCSRRARRRRSRRRGRWRPSGCATASAPPSRSARAGHASCTTRRCRGSPRSRCCSAG